MQKDLSSYTNSLQSANTQQFEGTNFSNDYGTIMSDFTKPYTNRTQIYQYDLPNECMQYTTNLHQKNYFDIRLPHPDLTDIESELRNITRIQSRLPQTRYRGNSNDINWLKPFKANTTECDRKIIDYDIKKILRNNDPLKLSNKI